VKSGVGTLLERLAAHALSAVEAGKLPPAAHRPWPLPEGPWIMAQRWENLLFAHWAVPRAALERLVPPNLTLETFDGAAWLGITPFTVSNLRLRALPAVPALSTFPEINVRTYVTAGGKPGVFFFSLDAGSALAVATARRWYLLPYFRAQFSVDTRDGHVLYANSRTHPNAAPADFSAEYRPTGDVSLAPRGTLAWWLTERYCLYTVDRRGSLYRAEIHHAPWPLQPADATIQRNTMSSPWNIELPGPPTLLHFARRLDVTVWPLTRVGGS
jgi:uncharacterized protein YqjF (DUF2071 family)